MKTFILLCLSALAVHVAANVDAGPYQTMWLWYAYEIDGMRDHPEMALGCEGTRTGGRCYFDEFLKYMEQETRMTITKDNGQKETIKATWQGSSSVGTNLNPDVDTTVNELKSQEGPNGETNALYRYQNKPENTKLFADVKNTFSAVHGKVMDVVQAARRELGEEKIATQLAAARKSMTSIHVARLANAAKEMTPVFAKQIANRKIYPTDRDVPITTETAPDGSTYDVVNTDEVGEKGAFGDDPDKAKTKREFVTDFKSKWDKGDYKVLGPAGKGAKGHADAVSAAAALERRIQGPPDC